MRLLGFSGSLSGQKGREAHEEGDRINPPVIMKD